MRRRKHCRSKGLVLVSIGYICLSACQQVDNFKTGSQLTVEEATEDQTADTNKSSESQSQLSDSDAVVAPTPVHGAYLGGLIVEGTLNESQEITIGIGALSLTNSTVVQIEDNQPSSVRWDLRILIETEREGSLSLSGSLSRSQYERFQRETHLLSNSGPITRDHLALVSITMTYTDSQNNAERYALQASLLDMVLAYENQQRQALGTHRNQLSIYPNQSQARLEWQPNSEFRRYQLLRSLDRLQIRPELIESQGSLDFSMIFDGPEASYIDVDVKPDTRYLYQLWALNEDGVWTQLSKDATLVADFRYSYHLAGKNLSGLDLLDTNFEAALLRGSNLLEADLSGANLSNADLSGATWVDGRTCLEASIGSCR